MPKDTLKNSRTDVPRDLYAKTFINVVFPAPLAPIIATKFPGHTTPVANLWITAKIEECIQMERDVRSVRQ
jgi:hypothetical protein